MPRIKKRWWPFHRYSIFGAKRMGKKDGKSNPPIPPWDSPNQPPYILELVEAAEHDIRLYLDNWKKRDGILEKEMGSAEIRKDNAKVSRDNAKKTLYDAEKEYEQKMGTKPPVGGGGKAWYWLFVGLLFIAEFPLNSIVFRVFGESEILTMLVTLVMAISIVGCAHFLGNIIKENKWGRIEIIFTVFLILVPLAVLYFVAFLREKYLKGITEGFQWTEAMKWGFWGINIIIFLVATIASYFAHDPLLQNVKRARKKYKRAQDEYESALTKLIEKLNERISKAEEYLYKMRWIKDTAQYLMHIYRTENLRIRKDKGDKNDYPKSFLKENQPEIARIEFVEMENRINEMKNALKDLQEKEKPEELSERFNPKK